MKELTDEQVERAAKVVCPLNWDVAGAEEKSAYRDRIQMAAPFLQLPWDEPTEDEVSDIEALIQSTGAPHWFNGDCLKEFVRRRNAALLPKPVDPRRAVLLKQLSTFNVRDEQELEEEVTEILAAMDEVK